MFLLCFLELRRRQLSNGDRVIRAPPGDDGAAAVGYDFGGDGCPTTFLVLAAGFGDGTVDGGRGSGDHDGGGARVAGAGGAAGNRGSGGAAAGAIVRGLSLLLERESRRQG